MIHGNNISVQPGIFLPAKGSACFHSKSGPYLFRQYTFPIVFRLLFKYFPGRHADDPGIDSLLFQNLLCLYNQLYFGTGSHQNHIRYFLFRILQDIGTLQCTPARTIQQRQVLTGQRQSGGTVGSGQCGHISCCSFPGICGPDHRKVRNAAQGSQLLNGLMGGPVLSHTDAVMSQNIKHRQLHHGRQPHGAFHVITEYKESGNIDG